MPSAPLPPSLDAAALPPPPHAAAPPPPSPLPRYLLRVEYDGAAYSGWQRQRAVRSVQAALEARRVLARPLSLSPLDRRGAALLTRCTRARCRSPA
jgi:hypothetical protein